jgi:hypothetical protein
MGFLSRRWCAGPAVQVENATPHSPHRRQAHAGPAEARRRTRL